MSSTRTAYTSLIISTAELHQLDPNLFEALVLTESAGRADAFRFEPQFAQRYKIAEKYPQWPVRSVAASYGLTQVMCSTAYELGWRDACPEYLFIPEVNLYWGGLYLHECLVWAAGFKAPEADTLRGALCAYNGGRNSHTSPLNPRPFNIAYAAKVLSIVKELA